LTKDFNKDKPEKQVKFILKLMIGICPVREELYAQAFDELIR
jgi:hypothetical protein